MHVLILALRRGIINTKFASFFLANWLSYSFDRMILGKKWNGGGSLVALRFFGYLKRQLELVIFLRMFLLVKDKRNL